MTTAENMPALAAVVTERETTPPHNRRHPAQVTADRLHAHAAKYDEFLTPQDAKAFGAVIVALDQIPARMRQAGVDE